jgi:hypothetical protein
MSSTMTRPETRPEAVGERELRSRLAGLRRRLRLVVASRGLGWLVACVLLTLVGVGAIDYRIDLPALVRAVVLTGLLAGVGVILTRFLFRPLRLPTDDLSLALRIEDRYPLLNDGLASTVQFLAQGGGTGDSPGMRREAIRRTLGKIAGLDFDKVIDGRGTRPAVVAALVALALAIPAAIFWPTLAGTAIARLANPFAAIDWPKKTRLELDDVPARIGRNREYRVAGLVRGVVPREVVVELSHEGFPVQRKTYSVGLDDRFVMHLKPDEVQRNFRFRVVANDAATPEYPVEVLALPRLVSLGGKPSPQVRLDLPPYTDLPTPQSLSPGQGNLDLFVGTVVTLRAAADRPLERAWIMYQPELAGTTQAAALAPVGIASPLAAVGTLLLSRGMHQPIPARLGADRRSFDIVFRPSVHGMYTLGFVDENGLENAQTFEVRLRLDAAPVVSLERPAPSKDAFEVLPTAELPLSAIIDDKPFAVRSAWLEYRTRPEEEPRRLALFDATRGPGHEFGALLGVAIGAAPVRVRLPRIDVNQTIRLATIRHPDGSPLKEGDTLTLQVKADDFDDVSVGKPPGESHKVTIRVVGRDRFDAEVNRKQAGIQKELLALRDKEREALTKVREAEARVRKGEKLSPDKEAIQAEAEARKAQDDALAEKQKAEKAENEAEKKKHEEAAAELAAKAKKLEARAQELKKQSTQVAEAEQLQQQVREKVGSEKEGLRAEIEKVRETLRQNGMANSNAMERMKAVSRELERLAERELDQIEPKLANARKMSELQDEKTWKERRNTLEDRARQEELAAREAEARASKLDDRAKKAEEESKEGDARGRKAEEARRAREQAAEQRKSAAEQRAQAERDRRDAADKPDPAKVRQDLSDARRGQEEVEKSLNSLLQDLEPWSNNEQITGEASRIAQEQKELQAQLDELTKKDINGKGRDELKEEERAELDALQDKQKRLAERTAELLEQMKKQAEKQAEKDGETASEMKKAAERAESKNLVGQMKSAQEKIGQNLLNEARKDQREALAELEKLQQDLKDSREARLDRLARKMKEAEARVEELLDEQEKLQRKIREASKIQDPKKREEELARLARSQKELQRKTKDVLERVTRSGNQRAKQALEQTQEEMAEAVKRLERNKPDDEKQEDALDRLDEARRELQQARKKAEEELGREQLVRVADMIRRIRDRQEGHSTEAKRLQDLVLERKGWQRKLLSSLGDLAENQKGLADETAAVAKKDLSSAPVFARLLQRAARAMEEAGKRAIAIRETPPALDAIPDRELNRLQAEAMRRLDQLLSSLKDAQDEPRPLSRGGDRGDEEPGGGGGGGDDSLPPLAQLKLLRAMQNEVNARTKAFVEAHADPAQLGPKEKADLQDIRREQTEVADLLALLTRSAGDEPDEGEKPMPRMDDKKEEEKP